MVIKIFFFKLKSLVLLIVSVINKALCCFRRRRCEDNVVLTHVVSNRDGIPDDDWSNWIDENSETQKPKTVQDHIEMYRKQIATNLQKQEESEEHHLNFFEDMAPKIIKQTKHLIKPSVQENGTSNRLNFKEDAFTHSLPTKELGEWEESSGWEGETLDWDAQQALREKKRQDRERKALEKMQKRQEKMNRSLGARVNS